MTHILFPGGGGIFCFSVSKVAPRTGAFDAFCKLLTTIPHPCPGVRGVGIYFDWCIITILFENASHTRVYFEI